MGKVSNFLVGSNLLAQSLVNIFGYVTLYIGGGGVGGVKNNSYTYEMCLSS
jgi:hypothetical protein